MANRCQLSIEQLRELSRAHLTRREDKLAHREIYAAELHLQSALAIDELIEFREGINAPLRKLQRGLAYRHARESITSFCIFERQVNDRTFYDTGTVPEECADDVREAVLYLDLMGYLYRHPTELNWIAFPESEAALA